MHRITASAKLKYVSQIRGNTPFEQGYFFQFCSKLLLMFHPTLEVCGMAFYEQHKNLEHLFYITTHVIA